MTLYELGEEYALQSQKIRQEITNRRGKLFLYHGIELIEEKRKIANLYSIAADCARIGEKLKHYYDPEPGYP